MLEEPPLMVRMWEGLEDMMRFCRLRLRESVSWVRDNSLRPTIFDPRSRERQF